MKIISKIINIITTLIIITGVLFILLYLYGIVPYVVLSGSMEPTIKTGSLCFINKNIKYTNIKENDIIAFKLNKKTLVTHRAIKINNKGIQTKGDNNTKADQIIITKENYVGKNILWIPKIGYIVVAFQSTTGKIIIISIIAVLLLSTILYGENNKNK